MAFLDRLRSRAEAPSTATTDPEPWWLPGPVEVEVAGESYHADAVALAYQAAAAGAHLAGVLEPEPTNRFDPNAVAVYVLGRHVGYLPADVAARVQPALRTRGWQHGGRVACPVAFRLAPTPQVLLSLDPRPLGLTAEDFGHQTPLSITLRALLPSLRAGTPVADGVDPRTRAELNDVERCRQLVEADWERAPDAYVKLERRFRAVAGLLDEARDAAAALAWLGVARSVRYQRGRREDTLAAFAEAIKRDPEQVPPWLELVDYGTLAPDVETLLALVAVAPLTVRPALLPTLLSVSYGTDRVGKLGAEAGTRLRAGLFGLAECEADRGSLAVLCVDAGRRAAKAGDEVGAHSWWRRAVAAGSTDPGIVDRLTIWLVKESIYSEAAPALRQALAVPLEAASVRARLEKRLARCERKLGKTPRDGEQP